jgi:hypothetical protein
MALFVLSPAAFAGAGLINTNVTTLGDVTYSLPASGKNTASPNYFGAKVSVSSDPSNTNTINNVRFTATVVVNNASGKATFSSAQGATCNTTVNPGTATNDGTSIECQIGQLKAGQPFPDFVIFFAAPNQGQGDPNAATITLQGRTWYAEGTGGVPGPSPENSFDDWDPKSFNLGVSDTKKLRTAVASSGGRFFTGFFGVPNKTDDFFATTLVVPAVTTGYSTATIDESLPKSGASDPAYLKCPTGYTGCKDIAEISVKDQTGATRPFESTSPLVIILRRDKSQFTGNFNNQPVWWFNGTLSLYEQIDTCNNNANPLDGDVERCVKECKVLRNGDPEVKDNPELSGDGQCTILTEKNGFYAW